MRCLLLVFLFCHLVQARSVADNRKKRDTHNFFDKLSSFGSLFNEPQVDTATQSPATSLDSFMGNQDHQHSHHDHSHPPAIPNQRPTFPNQQPQFPNQQPQFPNQQPQFPNQPPQFPNQPLQFPNQQPQFPNQQPLFPNQQQQFQSTNQFPNQWPQFPNQQPPFPNQQPQFPNQQPQFPSQQQTQFTNQQSQSPDQQPQSPDQELDNPDQQPPPQFPNQPPQFLNQQPQFPNQQPQFPNQQPQFPNSPNQQPPLPGQEYSAPFNAWSPTPAGSELTNRFPSHPNTGHQPWWRRPSGQPNHFISSFPPPPTSHPWWRQPPPPPTIPDYKTPHPSQPMYISPYQLPPNKQPHPGVPNKIPSVKPLYPPPRFNMGPSPLNLPKEECITIKGELGECLSYFHCGTEGGHPSGLCHLGHDVSAHARTCCVFPSYCGFETNKQVTYFKNPNYPNITSNTGDCLYRVNLQPGVCQVRVDFLDLRLKPLVNGDCDPTNSLTISSNDRHAHVAVDQLCGTVSQGYVDPLRTDIPHVYIHVDDDIPIDRPNFKAPNSHPMNVNFKFKATNYPSRWNLRISQIHCEGASLEAPSGCSQYYNQNKGNITSINYQDGAYRNNLDMTICIKRDPAACAIKYRLHTMAVGPTKGGTPGKSQLGYGLTCDDYLVFNGEKTAMCGSLSKGARDVVLPVRGPQGLTLHTDQIHIPKADAGFHIEYEYLHNCNEVEFYKYPVPGRRN